MDQTISLQYKGKNAKKAFTLHDSHFKREIKKKKRYSSANEGVSLQQSVEKSEERLPISYPAG